MVILQVFGGFPVIFLLLISNLIPLWLVIHTVYDLNSLKSVEVCSVSQSLIVYVPCTLENNCVKTIENNVCSATVGLSVL